MAKARFLILLLLPIHLVAQYLEVDYNERSLHGEVCQDILHMDNISKVIHVSTYPCLDTSSTCVSIAISDNSLHSDTILFRDDVLVFKKVLAQYNDLFLFIYKSKEDLKAYIEAFQANGTLAWKAEVFLGVENAEDLMVSDFIIKDDHIYIMSYGPQRNIDFIVSYDLNKRIIDSNCTLEEGESRSGNIHIYKDTVVISRSTFNKDMERGFVVLSDSLEVVREVYFPFDDLINSNSTLYSCLIDSLIVLTVDNQDFGGIFGLSAYTLDGKHQWTVDMDGMTQRKSFFRGLFSYKNRVYAIGRSEYSSDYTHAGALFIFDRFGVPIDKKFLGLIEQYDWLPYHFVELENVSITNDEYFYFAGVIIGLYEKDTSVVNGNSLIIRMDSTFCTYKDCSNFTHLDRFHELVDTHNVWHIINQPFSQQTMYRFNPTSFYFDSTQNNYVGWFDFGDKYVLQERNNEDVEWRDTDTVLVENMKGEVRIETPQGEYLLYDMRADVGDHFFDLYQSDHLVVVDKDSIILENGSLRSRVHLKDPEDESGNTIHWIQGIGSTTGLIPPFNEGKEENSIQCLEHFDFKNIPMFVQDTCPVTFDRILKEGSEWVYLCENENTVDTITYRFIINDESNEEIYPTFNTHVYTPEVKVNSGNWMPYNDPYDLYEVDGIVHTWWGDCFQCYGEIFDIKRKAEETMVYTFSQEMEIFQIDSLQTLDGNLRKRVSFSGFNNDTITYVEGIGSLGNFIVPYSMGELYKHTYNGQVLYENLEAGKGTCRTRTSVKDIDSYRLEEIKIYPNPFSNFLNIRITENTEVKIEILNFTGSSVFESNLNSSIVLNTNSWEEGTYFIRVKSKDKIIFSSKYLLIR